MTDTAAVPAASLPQHPFRTAVESGDLDGMVAALAEGVRLHSPIAFQPFEGKAQVRELFRNLLEVFEGFHYVDELAGDGTHALIFRAQIGGKDVEGLDHLRFGADGRVEDFTVMVRPLSGALALAEAMRERAAGIKG